MQKGCSSRLATKTWLANLACALQLASRRNRSSCTRRIQDDRSTVYSLCLKTLYSIRLKTTRPYTTCLLQRISNGLDGPTTPTPGGRSGVQAPSLLLLLRTCALITNCILLNFQPLAAGCIVRVLLNNWSCESLHMVATCG